MDPVKARLISKGHKSRIETAEVTLVMGGQHYTVHAHNVRGKWIGHNPDKAAVVRLNVAERLESESAKRYEMLGLDLDYYDKKLEENKAASKEEGADKLALRADARTLRAKRKETEGKSIEAGQTAKAKKAEADKIRGEVTRMIEVVF